MKQFTQEQQTEIVKQARNLTATIELEEREVRKLKGQQFKNIPTQPIRQMVIKGKEIKPEYPQKPEVQYTYKDHVKSLLKIEEGTNKTGLIIVAIVILFFAGWIIGLSFILSVVSYFKRKKEIGEELVNSPEYLQAISNAEQIAKEKQVEYDKQLDEQQKDFDAKYEKEKEHYDMVVLPKYTEEKKVWKENQERKIAIIEEEIRLNKETLNDLYDETKLVSTTYRPLWILSWLYEDMSTSDHDIRYATELLDRDRQRLATEEAGQIVRKSVGQLENTMLQGMNAIYNTIDYGNYLQEEVIDELSKTRRDMNIANVVGTVQRHNTNKMLKELVPKK